jgi:hypothetical protein
MGDIKVQLLNLAERLNGASVLGETRRPDYLETVEYQRVSLVQQHESLGTIVHYLVKANYSTTEDFGQLLNILRQADKYDNLLGIFAFFILLLAMSTGLGHSHLVHGRSGSPISLLELWLMNF